MNPAEGVRDFPRSPGVRKRGATLVLVLAVFAVVLLTLAAALATSTSAGLAARSEVARIEARALAEGATAIALDQLERRLSGESQLELSGEAAVGERIVPYAIRPLGPEAPIQGEDGWCGSVSHAVVEAVAELEESAARCRLVVRVTRSSALATVLVTRAPARLAFALPSALRGRVLAEDDLHIARSCRFTLDAASLRALGSIEVPHAADGPSAVRLKVRGRLAFESLSKEAIDRSRASTTPDEDPWRGALSDAASARGRLVLDGVATREGLAHACARAGLRIVDETAFDREGRAVRLPPGTLRPASVWNARTEREERVIDLDLVSLARSGRLPSDGVISFVSTAGDRSLRIVRAASLPAALAFVTEGALWVKGDFNRDARRLALLAADSVHLLSASWDDTKTRGVLPRATSTRVAASFVTGFEARAADERSMATIPFDVLRLHEDWNGAVLEIEGALVVAFASAEPAAARDLADRFEPPRLVWHHDRRLLRQIPPAAPAAFLLERIYWDDGLALPHGP